MNKIFLKKDIQNMFLSFFICLFPRIIMALQMIPLVEPRDEVSTMVGAAFFAGMDWSNVISTGGAYYGLGYTALFAPILALTESPTILYKSILVFSSSLFSLIAPLSYYLFYTYFGITNKKYLIVSSIACSYMIAGTVGPVAMNEAMLVLIVWLIVWSLLKILNSDSFRDMIKWTGVIVLLVTYAQTIHTRAIVLYIAAICLLFLKGVTDRKRETISYIILTLGLLVFGYYIAKSFNEYCQNAIWNVSDNSNLTNAYIEADASTFELLMSQKSWHAWFSIILGQLNTIIIYTGGFATICMVLIGNKFIQRFRNKENILLANAKEDVSLFVIVFFSLICVALTIGGQSLIWLAGVVNAFSDGYGTSNYGIRALTYVRYFGCYVGPILFCGLVLLYKLGNYAKKIFNISVGITLVLHLYWFFCIIPYLYNNDASIDIFTALSFSKWDTPASLPVYLSGSVFLLILMILFGYLIYKNRLTLCVLVLGIFLGYQHIYLYGTYIAKTQEIYYTVDSGIDFVDKMRKEGGYENTIYVLGNQVPYTYQFYLNTETLKWQIPDEIEEEAIVLMNSLDQADELVALKYKFVMLDENEYAAVKGDELIDIASRYGYQVLDFIPDVRSLIVEKSNANLETSTFKNLDEFAVSSNAITLEAGTYAFEIYYNDDIKYSKAYVVANDGEVILSELDKVTAGEDHALLFSIPQKTAGIKLYLFSQDSLSEDASCEVVCRKISSSFTVGLNNLNDMMAIKEKIEAFDDVTNIFYIGNDDIDDISALETYFSNYQISVKSVYEIDKTDSNAYVLILDGNKNWYDLLDEYVICLQFQDYLLLAPRESKMVQSIPEEQRLSNGKEIATRYWMNRQGEYYTDTLSLHAGMFIISIKLPEAVEGPIYVNIKDGDRILYTENLNVSDDLFVRFETDSNISQLICEVKNENGELVDSYINAIIVEGAGIKYWYNCNLQKLINNWEGFSEKAEELHVGLLSEGQVVELNNYMENAKKSMIKAYSMDEVEESLTQSTDIILPKNSIEMYSLLDANYNILDVSEEYVLLVKRGDWPSSYYEDETVLSDFYMTEEGYSINMPAGVYELIFETDVKTNDSAQDDVLNTALGFIQVAASGRNLSERYIYSGKSQISIMVSSKTNISNLDFSVFQKSDNDFNVSLVGTRRVSDGYMIDLQSMHTVAAMVTEDGIISTQEGDMTIFGPYISLEQGMYEVDFYYETSSQEKIMFDISANGGADIISTSAESQTVKVEGIYRTTLNFQLDTSANSVEFRSYSPATETFKLKHIIVREVSE